jgi:hypothetical protein
VRDTITRAGLYFPGSPCDRLPDDAYDASLAVKVSGSRDVPPDLDSVVLNVDVGHAGRGSPWLGGRALARPDGCGRIQISATVSDETGTVAYRDVIGLPRSLFPGQGLHLRTDLVRGSKPAPHLSADHEYHLTLGLQQAGVRAFTSPGSSVSVAL